MGLCGRLCVLAVILPALATASISIQERTAAYDAGTLNDELALASLIATNHAGQEELKLAFDQGLVEYRLEMGRLEEVNSFLESLGAGFRAAVLDEIKEGLSEIGDFIIIRPVNPGVTDDGARLGKGMNVKGKSTKRKGSVKGLVPWVQTADTTQRLNVKQSSFDYLQYDVNKNLKISQKFLARCAEEANSCRAKNRNIVCSQLLTIVGTAYAQSRDSGEVVELPRIVLDDVFRPVHEHPTGKPVKILKRDEETEVFVAATEDEEGLWDQFVVYNYDDDKTFLINTATGEMTGPFEPYDGDYFNSNMEAMDLGGCEPEKRRIRAKGLVFDVVLATGRIEGPLDAEIDEDLDYDGCPAFVQIPGQVEGGVLGYYVFGPDEVNPCDVRLESVRTKPVQSDYDILTIGNCNGMEGDVRLFRDHPADTVDLIQGAMQWLYSDTVGLDVSKWSEQPANAEEVEAKRKFQDAYYRFTGHRVLLDGTYEMIDTPEGLLYGLTGPQTKDMIMTLADKTSGSGSVRHASENWNYFFPQPIPRRPEEDVSNPEPMIILRRVTAGSRPDAFRYALFSWFEDLIVELDTMVISGCKCVGTSFMWLAQLDLKNSEECNLYKRLSTGDRTCPLLNEGAPNPVSVREMIKEVKSMIESTGNQNLGGLVCLGELSRTSKAMMIRNGQEVPRVLVGMDQQDLDDIEAHPEREGLLFGGIKHVEDIYVDSDEELEELLQDMEELLK